MMSFHISRSRLHHACRRHYFPLTPLGWIMAACFLPTHIAKAQEIKEGMKIETKVESKISDKEKLKEIQVKAERDKEISYEASHSRVGTKMTMPLRDLPQTVNIVTAPVLREQNASSIQDALQNVAGLSFSVGDGQRDQVSIRGFSSLLDQFVDGLRDDAMYFRDLSNIDRVEVLKGPASVLYGRGSSGGIIHRVTKKPLSESLNEVALTASQHGQKRAQWDANFALNESENAFRLTGAVENSSSFRQQYFLERQAIAPSLRYRITPDTQILIQADYLHDKRLADQGIPAYRGRPANVPIETYYGAANGKEQAYIKSDVYSTHFTMDHRWDDSLQWHSVIRYYDYQLNRNYTGNTVKDGAIPTLTLNQSQRLRDEKGSYWQNELTQKWQVGDVKHQMLYGLELGYQRKKELLRNRNNVATMPLLNPQLVPLSALPDNTPISAHNANRINVAGWYWQDLMTLNAEWKALTGLRYDQLQHQRDDLTPKNQDLKRSDHTLSPRVGLIWQPITSTSWYATWNRSFQPTADLFTLRNNSDQLKPAETTNKEIGVKYDVNGQASLTMSIFNTSQDHIHVADPSNANFSLPVGRQSTKGLEMSLTGNILPDWQVITGYAWMRGKIDRSTELTSAKTSFQGNISALTPTHSGHLWLRHTLNPEWYIAIGGRAESMRFASPDNLVKLPGYGVLQLGAGCQTQKLELNATVHNLLNRRYFVAAHSGANDYNMPGAPRGITASLRYRF